MLRDFFYPSVSRLKSRAALYAISFVKISDKILNLYKRMPLQSLTQQALNPHLILNNKKNKTQTV